MSKSSSEELLLARVVELEMRGGAGTYPQAVALGDVLSATVRVDACAEERGDGVFLRLVLPRRGSGIGQEPTR